MGKFRVGDIAIAVKPADRDDLFNVHGAEVTILAPLRRRLMSTSGRIAWCYKVSWPGRSADYSLYALPEWLRRKEKKISWADCIFKPDECPVAVQGESG